ncbi:MAG: 30S ribosomal protein S21 [Rickettsiales bacterium]|nr:30S ribosomal protein S21 [Rickettsiales bacterium]
MVHNNNVDDALKKLKRELQKEGVFKAIKAKRHYEKPSVRKLREKNESQRRRRKLERKRNFES